MVIILHKLFVSDGCGEVTRKQAGFPPQLAFPPGLTGAVQDHDNITGLELQLIGLLSVETVHGLDLQCGGGTVLQEEGRYRYR